MEKERGSLFRLHLTVWCDDCCSALILFKEARNYAYCRWRSDPKGKGKSNTSWLWLMWTLNLSRNQVVGSGLGLSRIPQIAWHKRVLWKSQSRLFFPLVFFYGSCKLLLGFSTLRVLCLQSGSSICCPSNWLLEMQIAGLVSPLFFQVSFPSTQSLVLYRTRVAIPSRGILDAKLQSTRFFEFSNPPGVGLLLSNNKAESVSAFCFVSNWGTMLNRTDLRVIFCFLAYAICG